MELKNEKRKPGKEKRLVPIGKNKDKEWKGGINEVKKNINKIGKRRF